MSPLTQRHRSQQLLLRRATVAQLARLWPALDWTRLDATYPTFAIQVAGMVQQNRQTSAGLAASYLRAFRSAEGIRGEVRTVLAEPLVVDQFAPTLHSTTVAAAKSSAARGIAADVAMSNALTLAQGAMARLVLDAGRQTVTRTLAKEGARWQRILGGGGCDFCQMLAGRGAVYAADTADFEAHGHCGCTAEPVY